jgi:hypothetical protein
MRRTRSASSAPKAAKFGASLCSVIFQYPNLAREPSRDVVAACMANGLVKGEGFAVDASVMEANASRYHGKAPDELDCGRTHRVRSGRSPSPGQ